MTERPESDSGGLPISEAGARHRVRALAMNLLRICAGAGKPWEFRHDLLTAAEQLVLFDGDPVPLVEDALRIEIEEGTNAFVDLSEATVGGLRLAAATLEGSRTRISVSRGQIIDAVRSRQRP